MASKGLLHNLKALIVDRPINLLPFQGIRLGSQKKRDAYRLLEIKVVVILKVVGLIALP